MTTYIKYFNNSIKKLRKQAPADPTLITIEEYKRTRNYKDYYETLDNLGLKVGVEYFVEQVYDENKDKFVSFIPSLKFHKDNPITRRFEIVKLNEFKSINKAYEYAAKELVYRLMTIRDLDNFIASR